MKRILLMALIILSTGAATFGANLRCKWYYNDCMVEVYEGGGQWILEVDCEDGTGGVWDGEGEWNGRCPGD